MTDHDSQKAAREAAAAFIQSASKPAQEETEEATPAAAQDALDGDATGEAPADSAEQPEGDAAECCGDAAPSADSAEEAPALQAEAAPGDEAAADGSSAHEDAPVALVAEPAEDAPAVNAFAPEAAAVAVPAVVSPMAYGSVGTARAQGKKKGSGALAVVIGLVICALVAVTVVAYLFTSGFFTHQPAQQTQRVPLSDQRVLAAFDGLVLDTPDISQYAYVSQDALIGPKFSDIVLNEPVSLGFGGNQVVQCTATATATFKNKGVEIAVPVSLPFDYSESGETWVPGELTRGEATATPLASASASEILANLNDILTGFDATYGAAMAGASITQTSSNLSVDGGTITVGLSKQAETAVEGKTIVETRTCTVTLNVAWSNSEGWLVTVGEAGQIDYKKDEVVVKDEKEEEKDKAEEKDEEKAPTVEARTETEPDNLGAVNFGDTVSLPGTLVAIGNTSDLAMGNNYNDQSRTADGDGHVQLALKLHRPMDVTVNGTQYRLNSIAVAVSGVEAANLVNRKAEVSGPLEETFNTNWSPLAIKALEIHLEE